MKSSNLFKKTMLSFGVMVMMGMAAMPAMASKGHGDKDMGLLRSLGVFGGADKISQMHPMGNMHMMHMSGMPFFGGLMGLGDSTVSFSRTVTETFNKIPSAITITRMPGEVVVEPEEPVIEAVGR